MARTVGSVRWVVVASPQYLQKRGVPERPAALAQHDIIFGTTQRRPSEWRFGSRERGAVVRFTPRLAVNEAESQLIAARAGRGVARLLSYQAALDVAAGTLVRVLEAYEPEALPVQLVTPSPRIVPKVRAFLETASAVLERLEVIRGAGAVRRPGNYAPA
jgi:DNA-binding transcriptional LysR family regulator